MKQGNKKWNESGRYDSFTDFVLKEYVIHFRYTTGAIFEILNATKKTIFSTTIKNDVFNNLTHAFYIKYNCNRFSANSTQNNMKKQLSTS